MPTTKRLVAALASVTLAIGGLAVTAAPASADEWDTDQGCTIHGFTPTEVVVGLRPVTKTFEPSISDCTTVNSWDMLADDWVFYVYDGAPSETFAPWSNSEAGARDVTVSASNGDWDTSETTLYDSFYLKRHTYWQKGSFNASPEPVRKGKSLTLKGRLKVADWSNDRYVGYGGQAVKIQYRSSAKAPWTTVKSVKTSKSGWVSAKVTAKKSGSFRVSFGGHSKAVKATSASDYVKVN